VTTGKRYYLEILFREFHSDRSRIFERWRIWGKREVRTGSWWGNLRERGHWGDPDVDGRIILRWIFRKLEEVVGTGWSWLRIGTGGGHL
jgi:hypothetical protein